MNVTLPTLVDLFIATKETEGRSPNTTRWYRNMLSRFVTFLGDQLKLADLSIDDARRLIANLQSRTVRFPNHPISHQKEGGLSPYTIACYVRVLKVFGTWLHEEAFTKSDLFARLKPPKLPENMFQVLTDAEINDLVGLLNPNSFLGVRNYAIVLLLLDTGIRASELCTLTLDSTDIQNGTIKVVGKGNKELIVPIGAGTRKALMRYAHTFRPEPPYDSTVGQCLHSQVAWDYPDMIRVLRPVLHGAPIVGLILVPQFGNVGLCVETAELRHLVAFKNACQVGICMGNALLPCQIPSCLCYGIGRHISQVNSDGLARGMHTSGRGFDIEASSIQCCEKAKTLSSAWTS